MQIKREANRKVAEDGTEGNFCDTEKSSVRTEQSDEKQLCEIGCINKMRVGKEAEK